jgi:hypothetical protein
VVTWLGGRWYRAVVFVLFVFFAAVFAPSCSAQQLAKRLILKDGSYQLVTKWEIHGDRVHYFSAERNEWEDVPNSLVDWAATNKYEKEREAGAPPPEAVQLDNEFAAEQKAEAAKTPEVAPGLHLEDPNTVYLLDTFQDQPQLAELSQSGGDIERNAGKNILRAALNPIASARQTIELPGSHAEVQSHVDLPSLYINATQQEQADETVQGPQAQQLSWDRFRIVRMEEKHGKRILGDIKITMFGKVSQQTKLVPATAQQLTGGWVMITPNAPLEKGEYALVEMLGKDNVNLYVWDFGIDPSAPANHLTLKASTSGPAAPVAPQPVQLQKREH